tara:strand:+ start:266 stop:460 length:195 start_codon:yes stop_codon:yes gene_type:complete
MAKVEAAEHVHQLEGWLTQLAVRWVGVESRAARLAVEYDRSKQGAHVAIGARKGAAVVCARPEA